MRYLKLFLAVGLMIGSLFDSTNVLAQKFSVKNSDGEKIYYSVLSKTEKTVSVVQSNSYKKSSYVIPETVNFKGTTYTVVEIGDEAFYEQDNLRESTTIHYTAYW